MNAPARIETGTMTSKGQILIPKAFRDAVGLVPGQPYKVTLDSTGQVIVAPLGWGGEVVRKRQEAQDTAIDAIAGRFDFGATTDEVMLQLRGDRSP